VLSRGNARKNDGLDALATALAASGNERLAAVDPEAASEVLRLLSAVGAKTWWPSAPERSRQPARASTRPPPRRDSWNALGRSGRAHPARHTSAGLLLARPPPTSFGAPAPRIRTLNRKIVDLNERIESEVEASATTLTEIFGVGPTGGEDHRNGRRGEALPEQGALRLLLRHGACGGLQRGGGAPQALAGRQP
jgi:hypothetical protein